MKLTKLHLFLGLLAVLLFSSYFLGGKLEGVENINKHEPKGVRKSDIPVGQDDLYVLKSEIVPPVCPKCPDNSDCPREKPCPPCPACARCPEPNFECKKVPNYSSVPASELPQPVLNSFAQFGL